MIFSSHLVLGAVHCLPKRHLPGILPGWQLASVGRGWRKGWGRLSAHSAVPDQAQAGSDVLAIAGRIFDAGLVPRISSPHYVMRLPQLSGDRKLGEFVNT